MLNHQLDRSPSAPPPTFSMSSSHRRPSPMNGTQSWGVPNDSARSFISSSMSNGGGDNETGIVCRVKEEVVRRTRNLIKQLPSHLLIGSPSSRSLIEPRSSVHSPRRDLPHGFPLIVTPAKNLECFYCLRHLTELTLTKQAAFQALPRLHRNSLRAGQGASRLTSTPLEVAA